MTLVLAYANTDFVTIAADRRITDSNGKLVDDSFTKTAVVYNRFVFGFTGLAQLSNGQHTMEWLVRAISPDNGIFTDKIAERATEEMKKLHVAAKWKRLALVGVGYDEKDQITYILITNMHDQNGVVVDKASDDFRVFVDKPMIRSTIRAVGQQIPSSVQSSALNILRDSHKRNLPSINRIHAILAGTIEKAANKTISSTALITTLPKSGKGKFDVVTPGSKPGQSVSLASPYMLFPGGAIMVMPQQMLRRSKKQS